MATTKAKAKPAAKKAPAKKNTTKKAAPTRAAASKKSTPAKKAVTTAKVAPRAVVGERLARVALTDIAPAGHNLRKKIDVDEEFLASIKRVGVLQPVLLEDCTGVCPRPAVKGGHKYHLVAGERRWTASTMAKLADIPAMIRSRLADDVRIEAMLFENLQREGLDPIEEADGFRRLGELGYSQHQIAERLKISQSHVSKRLVLLELPDEIQAVVGKSRDSGGITIEDGIALSKLKDHPNKQASIVKEAARDRYKKIESMVRREAQKLAREKKAATERDRRAEKGERVIGVNTSAKGAKAIQRKGRHYGGSGVELDVEDVSVHDAEPCHAIKVVPDQYSYSTGWKIVPHCTDLARHKPDGLSKIKVYDRDAGGTATSSPAAASAKETDAQKAERERLEAERARQESELEGRSQRIKAHLVAQLAKKVPADRALAVLSTHALWEEEFWIKDPALEDVLLGIDPPGNRAAFEAIENGGLDGAVQCALARVLSLGVYELDHPHNSFPAGSLKDDRVQLVYRFAIDTGYELVDDGEREAFGPKKEAIA